MRRSAAAAVDVDDVVESNERYTPEPVLQLVRKVAPIGLDPCTTRDNRTKARQWFTLEDNGLACDWNLCRRGELVWVNSPYSVGQLVRWAAKAVTTCAASADSELIMLTPCDLGTKWSTMLVNNADAMAGWRGRIPFVRPDGNYDTGAKQPSILWYFGERAARFDRAFRDHANVIRLPGARS